MAKLANPLFSDEAWGKMGQGLHYVRRQGGAYVRKHLCRTAPPTQQQVEKRKIYKSLVDEWNSLDDSERQKYREYPSLHLTRFNVFMKIRLGQIYGVKYPAVFGLAMFGQSTFGV